MDPNHKDILLKFQERYVTPYITQVMLLTVHIWNHDCEFPKDIILFLLEMMWRARHYDILSEYLCYEKPNRSDADFYTSSLTLADIVNSISEYGKVSIFATNDRYRFYIQFNNCIKCESESGIRVNSRGIDASPFDFPIINKHGRISSDSMYVYLDMNKIRYINDNLYTMIDKTRSDLSKCYVNQRGSHKFDNDNYKYDCHQTKEIKREIMMLWISDFGRHILESGFHFNKFDNLFKPITINEILSTDKDWRIIY